MTGVLLELYQARRIADASAEAAQAQDRVGRMQDELAFLRRRLDRMILVNAALWELVKGKTGLIDQELQAQVLELDAADGQIDGRLGGGKRLCRQCGKSLHPKHRTCLYCSTENAAVGVHAGI